MGRPTKSQAALREYIENTQAQVGDTKDAVKELGDVIMRYGCKGRLAEGIALGLDAEVAKIRDILVTVEVYSKLSLIKLDDVLDGK